MDNASGISSLLAEASGQQHVLMSKPEQLEEASRLAYEYLKNREELTAADDKIAIGMRLVQEQHSTLARHKALSMALRSKLRKDMPDAELALQNVLSSSYMRSVDKITALRNARAEVEAKVKETGKAYRSFLRVINEQYSPEVMQAVSASEDENPLPLHTRKAKTGRPRKERPPAVVQDVPTAASSQDTSFALSAPEEPSGSVQGFVKQVHPHLDDNAAQQNYLLPENRSPELDYPYNLSNFITPVTAFEEVVQCSTLQPSFDETIPLDVLTPVGEFEKGPAVEGPIAKELNNIDRTNDANASKNVPFAQSPPENATKESPVDRLSLGSNGSFDSQNLNRILNDATRSSANGSPAGETPGTPSNAWEVEILRTERESAEESIEKQQMDASSSKPEKRESNDSKKSKSENTTKNRRKKNKKESKKIESRTTREEFREESDEEESEKVDIDKSCSKSFENQTRRSPKVAVHEAENVRKVKAKEVEEKTREKETKEIGEVDSASQSHEKLGYKTRGAGQKKPKATHLKEKAKKKVQKVEAEEKARKESQEKAVQAEEKAKKKKAKEVEEKVNRKKAKEVEENADTQKVKEVEYKAKKEEEDKAKKEKVKKEKAKKKKVTTKEVKTEQTVLRRSNRLRKL